MSNTYLQLSQVKQVFRINHCNLTDFKPIPCSMHNDRTLKASLQMLGSPTGFTFVQIGRGKEVGRNLCVISSSVSLNRLGRTSTLFHSPWWIITCELLHYVRVHVGDAQSKVWFPFLDPYVILVGGEFSIGSRSGLGVSRLQLPLMIKRT